MAIQEDVSARIAELGYTVETADATAVSFAVSYAEMLIKAQINAETVPEGLLPVEIDMAAGLFLRTKKELGALGEAFDFSAPAKSVTEGSISVTLAGASDGVKTPEQRFDALLDRMTHPEPAVFAPYRRLSW